MRIVPAPLEGLFIVEVDVFRDERGYFFESFRKEWFDKKNIVGFSGEFLQDNESRSVCGVLRGLHYQLPPFEQAKLVRVVEGRIWDVAVDLRRSSPNFGRWFGVELSGENKRQLFIPRGFAHGFVVLSEFAIVQYKVDNYYSREHDRGVRFDDPQIGIDWPVERAKLIISAKDKALPTLKDAEVFD